MRLLVLLLALAAGAPALADSDLPPSPWAHRQLPDPEQERRAVALMSEIRCLVCAGQSIADSDAEMAGDMRSLVRQRVAAGESNRSIRDWLVARYGAGISFRPPVEPLTWPLWAAPLLLLLLGLWLARARLGRRR